MIRAAIFDVDGVLLDSLSIWWELGARYLRRRGLAPEKGLGRTLFSMSLPQGAAYLKEHYALPEAPEDIQEGIRSLLRDFYLHEVQPKPGCPEALTFLKSRGIPMAVATTSPRPLVEPALRRTGLFPFFSALLTTEEVGQEKTAPAIYRQAAQALSVSPSQTLVVEDSLYALQTAAGAGFPTAGVFDAMGEPDQQGLARAAAVYLPSLWALPAHWSLLNL